MTQERIVTTLLFITFLIVAYKMVRLLYKRPPMSGSTSCSSGACSTCAFKQETSCSDHSYTRENEMKVKQVKF